MFGIDQISWGEFILFLLFILLLWYVSVILHAVLKQTRGRRHNLFEEDSFTPGSSEGLSPKAVCAQDFPSELIPLRLSADIALPVSLYEDSGIDQGYAIECFAGQDNSRSQEILEKIQYQQ